MLAVFYVRWERYSFFQELHEKPSEPSEWRIVKRESIQGHVFTQLYDLKLAAIGYEAFQTIHLMQFYGLLSLADTAICNSSQAFQAVALWT